MLQPEDTVTYLGVQISPCRDFLKPNTGCTLTNLLDNVSKAPLKVTQKLTVLKTYVIPRITYVADLGMVGVSHLKECDKMIRKT